MMGASIESGHKSVALITGENGICDGVPDVSHSFWDRRASESPNVKHQRARATASRGKDELSLRALRCMR